MHKEDVYETFQVEHLTVKIVRDDIPMNPRDYDCGSLFFAWHKRYLVGDDPTKHGMPNSAHIHDEFESMDAIRAYIEETFKPKCILPVYMADHGGVSFSTGSFNDPWDSGQVGFIFTHGDDGFIDPEAALKAQVEEYSDWASGNVWGFVVEGAEYDGPESSCWGFIGDPSKSGVVEEGLASAKYLIEREHSETARCEAAVHL